MKVTNELTSSETKNLTRRAFLAAAGGAALLTLSACSHAGTSTTDAAHDSSQKNLRGSLSLAGSTSMQKVCEALRETFMEKFPNVRVSVEYTGSSAGIEALNAKRCDIANSSRELKAAELQAGLLPNVIAIDALAIILNPANPITSLTIEQLKAIYKGQIRSWKDCGGSEESIIAIGRENGSGSRSAFEELLSLKDSARYAQELDSTGAVLAKVAATPGGIGYISLDVMNDRVHAVALDGVQPTSDAIAQKRYSLVRPFIMATKGEISSQTPLVQAWFNYINSQEGKEIIKASGLILPSGAA